jgi:phytoene desaturase
MKSNHNKKAIVIGAGIAGIAAAIRLRVQGYNVEVYDKNEGPGGKITAFKLGDYQFDAGPSLFTQPENIQELFELAGEPMEDYFQYTSLPISFKYFYPDGSIVNAYTDNLKFANEMEQQLGEKKEKVLSYLGNAKKLYQHIAGLFLEHSLHRYQTFFSFRIFKAIATLRWKYIQQSMHDLNSRHFTKANTVQLFDRFATYNGSNPYQAPGMLSLIPHLELNQGTFYPKGGMISITNALYQLALKKGVQFHFLSKVEKILLQDQNAIGIQVQSERKPADLVISNVDVYFTYLKLLDQASMAQKVLKQERSSSACIFYWGINRSFPQLELHNIFFAENYQKEFESIFQTGMPYADPTIYINITSKIEPGIQAASGKENWFVMVNVSANTGQDWITTKAFYRAAIIAKLNKLLKVDLETCIEVEETLDPETIEQKTDSYMGSLYGTSSNSKQAAFLRHPNFSATIKNLYFVGGSVHPGGGIPLCLKSAAIMSRLVAEKHSKIHERKLA